MHNDLFLVSPIQYIINLSRESSTMPVPEEEKS